MSDLPDSWVVLSFGELNEFTSSTVNPARLSDETYDLFSVPSFSSGLPETLKGSAIGSTKQTVKLDDVLVCKINPRINRVWAVGKKETHEQIASSEWIGFRSQAVVPQYARHYFSSPRFRELMERDVAGVGGSLTRAQPKKVMTYPVPVAPISEQTRIAEQLDTLLTRINACHQRLDAIPALLKRFRQAVLSAAVSGELLEDPSVATFPRAALVSVLAEPLRNGKSVRDGDGVPVLRLTSLKAGGIDLSETKTGDWSEIKNVSRFLVQNGDYLVSRGNGSKELVGRGGLVAGSDSDIAFPDTMIRMRPDIARLSPTYLGIVWSSQPVRQQIELAAKTTAGIWKVSQPDLENVQLPLPSVEEQAKIVSRVEALFKLADRIEARYTAALAQAQRLPSLVLAKAFRGELLPQDPSDEPASDLLARIAAQRKSASPAPNTRQPPAPRAARAPKESAAMTKSRQDADVKDKPYLAGHLRRLGEPVAAQVLFKVSELPVADFYKQLAWEVAQGHVKDNTTTLEPGHAAG